MLPELFRIGNFAIHSYGFMLALAILISAIALYREAPRESLNPDYVLEAVIASSLVGLLGSRLFYVAQNWSYYSVRPFSAFFTQFEGLSFYGALICGPLALYGWSRWRKISFLKVTDLLAPYLALGYAFGRIGCFLNGCCYGKESDLPWALPVHMADEVLRHPVQLYAAAGGIALFLILKWLRPRRPFVGFISAALFGLYGLLRFTIEFFRHGELLWLNLTLAQWFSLGMIALAAGFVAAYYLMLPGKTKKDKKSSKKRKKKARH